MVAAKGKQRPPGGILLLAHGSPEPGVAIEAESLRRKLTRAGGDRVLYALAWLNRKPDLAAGVAGLAAKGCKTIHIEPLLLFRGKHLQRDLPLLVSEARRRHPGLNLDLAGPLTARPGFVRWFAGKPKSPAGSRR